MRPLLYLDTARLGQTLPAARDAQIDFVRLTAEEPSSLYFEEFLRNGYGAWPGWYQNRFPGLRTWTGVCGLKQSLRHQAGAPDDWTVLLASRSLFLVHLAARSMFSLCRNVLSTDLSWPTYQDVVTQQASTSGRRMTTVALRNAIFHHGWSVDDVATYVGQSFVENHCDGLFLPAVDHLGIRVPVRAIVERIQRTREIKFCFIDAAQAFCHVPLEESLECADFLVTGSHKWMRSGQPLGIGLFGKKSSRHLIRSTLCQIARTSTERDPLLQFTEQLDGGSLDGHSETVGLLPLFACAGGAAEQTRFAGNSSQAELDDVLSSLNCIPPSLADWQPVILHRDLCSKVLLFTNHLPRHQCERRESETVRKTWLAAGCIVTACMNGRVRVSAPVSVRSNASTCDEFPE